MKTFIVIRQIDQISEKPEATAFRVEAKESESLDILLSLCKATKLTALLLPLTY